VNAITGADAAHDRILSSCFPADTMSQSLHAERLAIEFCQRGIYADADSTADQNVHICPVCVDTTAATFTMFHNTRKATHTFWKQTMRTDCRTFCIQLVTFLSLQRDPVALAKLQDVLRSNLDKCPLKSDAAHSLIRKRLMIDTFDYLFNILDVLAKSIDPDTRQFSPTGAWPTNYGVDMLPHGPAQSCRGLISTWSNFESSSADTVLTLWFILCGPDLLSELIAQRAPFVPTVLARNKTVCVRAVRGQVTSRAEVRRFHTLAGLFIGLITAYQSNVDAIQRIFGDVKDELISTLDHITHATKALVEARMFSDDTLIPAAQRVSILVSTVFGFGSVKNGMAESLRLKMEASASELRGNVCEVTFRAICATRQQKRCDASGCTRNGQTADGDSLQLQRCSRCKFFAYCSRECQTAHWSTRPHSHKEVCPLFVKFQERVAPLDEVATDVNHFSEKCRANAIGLDELVTLQYYATTDLTREAGVNIDQHKQQWISSECSCVTSELAFGFWISG